MIAEDNYQRIRSWYIDNSDRLNDREAPEESIKASLQLIDFMQKFVLSPIERHAVFIEVLRGLLDWGYKESDGKKRMFEYAQEGIRESDFHEVMGEGEIEELKGRPIWPYLMFRYEEQDTTIRNAEESNVPPEVVDPMQERKTVPEIEPEEENRGPETEMPAITELSISSRSALGHADGMRKTQGLDRIHMEHLVFGLYKAKRGLTFTLFEEREIKEDVLVDILNKEVAFRAPIEYERVPVESMPKTSEHVSDAIKAAEKYRRRKSSGFLQSRDLLYGAFSVVDCSVIKGITEKTGIDLGVVTKHIGGTIPPVELSQDKIPFHYDRVVDTDNLGREPVARAFADLIRNDVFTKNLNHAFMVHLQGEWGAGKSSFLKLVEKKLNAGGKRWIVIEYNAWKNQHIKPPWWTFIDQIYQQAKSKLSFSRSAQLKRNENSRRILWYTGWQNILALFLTLIFIGLLWGFGGSLMDFLIEAPEANERIDNVGKGLTISVLAKLFVTLGSVVGLIYSFFKFLSNPFFVKSSKDAISFMERASDPLKRIKKHFSNLVDDITSGGQELAIFIDDIDRCDREFIVELLEGIQTLFKEKKVLYIVAGDKKWISTSFQNHYKEFDTENEDDDGRLGDLFLEKAFQLSVRMPVISEKDKKKFWSFILGRESGVSEETKSYEQLDQATKSNVIQDIQANRVDMKKRKFMESLESKYNLSPEAVSNLVIETQNANKDEIKHLLEDFHSLINENPRSIIRLANSYTMTSSTLIAERKDQEPDMLFRWLALKDYYPELDELLKISADDKELKKELRARLTSTVEYEKCEKLIDGINDRNPLSLDQMKFFAGI